MDVLIGTTNPAKVQRFKSLLDGFDVTIRTPRDFGISVSPVENGRDPMENAAIKAAFYSKYCDFAIGNDSGLYFTDLPMDDPRQPGLHVRSPQGVRLNDEEMIAYYSALAKSLGGRLTASYMDAVAVYAKGNIHVFRDSEQTLQDGAFYLTDTPSANRTPGWPLDSLSVNRHTFRYFSDESAQAPAPKQSKAFLDLQAFLLSALGIK